MEEKISKNKVLLKDIVTVDLGNLFKEAFPKIVIPDFSSKKTAFEKMALAAKTIYDRLGVDLIDEILLNPSDVVKSWGAFLIGYSSLSFPDSLIKIKPFADHKSETVRDWTSLAMRPKFMANVSKNLQLLNPFVYHPSEYMRRFAIELSRPRGIMSDPIAYLKERPWKAKSLLNPLHKDPSGYVQTSVGNWLCDANLSSAKWVKEITSHWAEISTSPYTENILKAVRKNLQMK